MNIHGIVYGTYAEKLSVPEKLLCNDICEGSPLFEVAFILPLDTVEEDCGTEHC